MNNKGNHTPAKVVVVTEADHGHGLEIAKQLSYLGVRLVLAGRDAHALHEITRELVWDGGMVLPVHADTVDYSQAEEVVAAAAGAFGRIDVMVNNSSSMHCFTRTDIAKRGPVLVGNSILSATNGTLAAFTYMRKQRGGHIINVLPTTVPGTVEQNILDASIKSGMFSLPSHPDEHVRHGVSMTLVVPPEPLYKRSTCTIAGTVFPECDCVRRTAAIARTVASTVSESIDLHVEQILFRQLNNSSCHWHKLPQPFKKTA